MNTISSAFLNPTTQGTPSTSTDSSGSADQAVEQLLQDIETLLEDASGNGSGGGSGSGSGSGLGSDGGLNLGAGSGGGSGGATSLPSTGSSLPSTGATPSAGATSPTPSAGATPSEGTVVPPGSGSGSGTSASSGAAGQDLRDVKINSTAGGEALHLQEDSQGNLYNGSGDDVGHVGADGSISLNSGATQEIQRLETGGNPFTALTGKEAKPNTEDGGNAVFSSSEVTIEAGDLDQKNDF